jgi:hypothetical protein
VRSHAEINQQVISFVDTAAGLLTSGYKSLFRKRKFKQFSLLLQILYRIHETPSL